MAAAVWEDERVVRGMGVHLQAQRDKGGTRIGWKMGLGLPAIMERLGTTGALVAELQDATLLQSGASLSVDGWARPVFEPEVAVFVGTDVEPGGDRDAAAAAITALAPAIEMVDLPSPPSDPGAVLEGGFAHRAVILGAQDASRAGGDFSGLSTTVTANGEPFAAEEDPEGAVGGDILGLVRHAADYLGAFGQRLEAGQFLDHRLHDRAPAAGRGRATPRVRPRRDRDRRGDAHVTGTTTAAESRLAMPGGEVNLLRGGDGPPLLFLHGGGGAGAWSPLHDALSRRFDVIAPDHPGFGRSDDFESFGGDRRPRLPLPTTSSTELGIDRRRRRRRVVRRLARGELAVARPARASTSSCSWPRSGCGCPTTRSPTSSSCSPSSGSPPLFHDPPRGARCLAEPTSTRSARRTATRRRSPATRGSRSSTTRSSSAGCAASRARRSWSGRTTTSVIPRAHAERYAERIADARLDVVEDCGHALYVERPEEIADVVARSCREEARSMKFNFFHLMPYPYLPEDFDERIATPSLTYPNGHFDPQVGNELYNRYLDELEYADGSASTASASTSTTRPPTG